MSIKENFEEYYNCFCDSNKIKRRKGLEGFLETFNSLENVCLGDLEDMFAQCEKELIALLSDESEVNRKKTAEILVKLTEKKVANKKSSSFIFSILSHRLGGTPVLEESEENRLEFLNLLEVLITSTNNENLVLHLDDVSKILTRSLLDKYPEAVVKACSIIDALPTLVKCHFPMFSNSFVTPLLKNITNQKFRIRISSIKTLGVIFIYGDCREFVEASSVLLKATFDIQQVKLALVSVGFDLARKMPDRYSFWPKILPLLLFGLRDDNSDVKKSAEMMWAVVGEQFEEENKDLMKTDYYNISVSVEYPFNYGCCALISRSFHTMLKDIDANVQDWQVDVRLQGIKLLSICVVGLLDNCIQYADTILKLILFSASDQDQRVASEAMSCAQLLGHHLPPDLYTRVVQSYLWGERNEPFGVLASLMSSTPSDKLKANIEEFVSLLSFNFVSSTQNEVRKAEILKILKMAFIHLSSDHFSCSFFFTLFYVGGSLQTRNELNNILQTVLANFQMKSVDEFFEKYMETFLMTLKDTETVWSEDSPELTVYSVLSDYKGFETHLGIVSTILESKAKNSSDALVAFITLESLEKVIERLKQSDDKVAQEKWTVYMITDHIDRLLPWKPGKTNQSLRMTAVSFLNLVVQKAATSGIQIYSALDISLKHLPDLITDELPETRATSCRLVELLAVHLDAEQLLTFVELLAKRLDDVNIKVRQNAASSLSVSSPHLSYVNELSARVELMVAEAAVFLLENDSSVRLSVFETLRNIAQKYPEEVRKGLTHQRISTAGMSTDLMEGLESLASLTI